jgi:FtsH-binding integral membrane protein
MKTESLVLTLVACFASAPLGVMLGIRRKKLNRSRSAFVGLCAVFVFIGFFLSLLILTVTSASLVPGAITGAIVSVSYSYLMVDAKAFQSIR